MNKGINVFCLPFAGGNRYSYREYKEKAPSFINFINMEYPGRGARIKEPLISDTDILVNDLYKDIITMIGDGDYAIYGHSLGGLITYLLTRKLMENYQGTNPSLYIRHYWSVGYFSWRKEKAFTSKTGIYPGIKRSKWHAGERSWRMMNY